MYSQVHCLRFSRISPTTELTIYTSEIPPNFIYTCIQPPFSWRFFYTHLWTIFTVLVHVTMVTGDRYLERLVIESKSLYQLNEISILYLLKCNLYFRKHKLELISRSCRSFTPIHSQLHSFYSPQNTLKIPVNNPILDSTYNDTPFPSAPPYISTI